MSIFNVEGIILKTKLYKENSKMITLFTPNKGKITIIGNSSQKLQSSSSAVFQVGNLIQAVLYQKQEDISMSVITQAKMVNQYPKTKMELMKLALSQYALEFVNKNTEDNEVNIPLYNYLKRALEDIESIPVTIHWKTMWDFHALVLLGFKPVVDHCVRTGENLKEGVFDIYQGGMTKKDLNHRGYYMGVDDVKYMRALQKKFNSEVNYPVPPNVKKAIDHMVNEYASGPFVTLSYYGIS